MSVAAFLLVIFALGFAAGYATRAAISHHRRMTARGVIPSSETKKLIRLLQEITKIIRPQTTDRRGLKDVTLDGPDERELGEAHRPRSTARHGRRQ